jgi:hypothetical protein
MSSTCRLQDCAPPEPLHGGHEYNLCRTGLLLNLRYAETLSREAAIDAEIHESPDSELDYRFKFLKSAVNERHDAMMAQFTHVKDCFICSVAFGLTPEVKPIRAPFVQLLAKFGRMITPLLH